jgi:hypothetical protein
MGSMNVTRTVPSRRGLEVLIMVFIFLGTF